MDISEEFLTWDVVEKMQPFIRHILYTLTKASLDTPLSLSEAARMMGVNRETLKKRCQRGSFPYTKVGEVYYISKIDVNLFIKGGTAELMKYDKSFRPQFPKDKPI